MVQWWKVASHHRAALRTQPAMPALLPPRSTKVLDQFREPMRLLHYIRRA